jgi:hypothetical protein
MEDPKDKHDRPKRAQLEMLESFVLESVMMEIQTILRTRQIDNSPEGKIAYGLHQADCPHERHDAQCNFFSTSDWVGQNRIHYRIMARDSLRERNLEDKLLKWDEELAMRERLGSGPIPGSRAKEGTAK